MYAPYGAGVICCIGLLFKWCKSGVKSALGFLQSVAITRVLGYQCTSNAWISIQERCKLSIQNGVAKVLHICQSPREYHTTPKQLIHVLVGTARDWKVVGCGVGHCPVVPRRV